MIQDRQRAPFPTAPAVPRDYVCTEMYTIQAGDTLYSISQRYGVPVSALMQVNDITNPYALRIDQRICIPGNGIIQNRAIENGAVCSGILHTIAPGDTPYMLANHYEVTLESLLQANPNMDPHNLRVGGQICIPGIQAPTPVVPTPTPAPAPAPVIPTPAPVIPTPTPVPRPTLPPMPVPIPPVPRPTPSPMPAPIPPVPRPTPVPIVPAPAPIAPAPQPMPVPTPTPTPPTPMVPLPTSRPPVREGPACSGRLYTVVEGDTLYMIARRHEVSLDALMEANPTLDRYNLEVGMKLCIPSVSEAPCPSSRPASPVREDCYFVRMGDSMDKICDRFRVLPRNLMKVNPTLTVVDYSIPGTKICIPSN